MYKAKTMHLQDNVGKTSHVCMCMLKKNFETGVPNLNK